MPDKTLKLTMLSMFVALGVVISPVLRIEGMCPAAHFINIVCAVLLGQYYALAAAAAIGIIRMLLMGIPPLALTGAVFGAFLSGLFYRAGNGKLPLAVLGEVIGTGVIGSIVSYPIMALFLGRAELSWFFYTPMFIGASLMGGSVAYAFLKTLAANNVLAKIQTKLGGKQYEK